MIDFSEEQNPAYLVHNDEWEILIAVDGVLHRPTPAERAALDAYYDATRDAWDPDTGLSRGLDGVEIPGIAGECVTYVVRSTSTGSGPSPSTG